VVKADFSAYRATNNTTIVAAKGSTDVPAIPATYFAAHITPFIAANNATEQTTIYKTFLSTLRAATGISNITTQFISHEFSIRATVASAQKNSYQYSVVITINTAN